MNTLIRFALLCLISSSAAGQTSLPACKGTVVENWSNCSGKSVYANGENYVGEFIEGKANGRGTHTEANGTVYVGQFKNNMYHGRGTLTLASGDKYVGEYKEGLQNGLGTATFANGETYTGQFRNNLHHGRGTLTFASGNVYVGEFKDGKFSGRGTFTFVSGNVYVGEFADGKYSGRGTFTFADGSRFVGDYKDNKRTGQGTYIFADGDSYIGEFKDGMADGSGTFTFASGDKYVGEFKDDKYNGRGTYTFADGSKFVGEYVDGKRTGQGAFYEKDGSLVESGIWANGTLTTSQPTSLQAAKSSEPDGTGSGFRIAKNTFITNHHVIDGCSRLKVNGQSAQVRQSDKRADLAQLRANVDGPAAKLRSQRTGIGEAVSIAGFPLRGLLSGFNMTTGTVSSLSGLGGSTQYFQITAPVQQGNSGGPLLDPAGNVAGVVVSKLDVLRVAEVTGDIPQNVNFAINTNSLRSFMDAGAVDYSVAGNDPALPLTTIAERARGFTVLVECWK